MIIDTHNKFFEWNIQKLIACTYKISTLIKFLKTSLQTQHRQIVYIYISRNINGVDNKLKKKNSRHSLRLMKYELYMWKEKRK